MFLSSDTPPFPFKLCSGVSVWQPTSQFSHSMFVILFLAFFLFYFYFYFFCGLVLILICWEHELDWCASGYNFLIKLRPRIEFGQVLLSDLHMLRRVDALGVNLVAEIMKGDKQDIPKGQAFYSSPRVYRERERERGQRRRSHGFQLLIIVCTHVLQPIQNINCSKHYMAFTGIQATRGRHRRTITWNIMENLLNIYLYKSDNVVIADCNPIFTTFDTKVNCLKHRQNAKRNECI